MKPSAAHRFFTLIHCALIPSILAVGGILAIVLPKPTVSQYERRELTPFPEFSLSSLFRGEFTSQLDNYFADTFPMRESLVKLGARLEDMRGIRFDELRLHETTPQPSQPETAVTLPEQNSASSQQSSTSLSAQSSAASSDASASTSSQETSSTATTDPGTVAPEQYNSILVYQNRAMAPFGGSEAMGGYYASVLSQYQQTLGDSVTIYNLLVPTSIEFYLPEKYRRVMR